MLKRVKKRCNAVDRIFYDAITSDCYLMTRHHEKNKKKPLKIGRARKFLNRILSGTHHHYSCFFPRGIKSLPALGMRHFFSGVTVSETQISVIRELPEDAIVVYATKHKDRFEYFFSHTRYQEQEAGGKETGLLCPEIGLDYGTFLWQPMSRIFKMIVARLDYFMAVRTLPDPYKSGYIRQELLNGRAGILFLMEKKGFRRRFIKRRTDPLQYLLETQETTSRPICIVPQLMFFSKIPPRANSRLLGRVFRNEERPGRIKKALTVFKKPGKIFVELSDPVNLKEFVAEQKQQSQSHELQSIALRQELLDRLNNHRQTIVGPILKSRVEIKESILTSDRLRGAMAEDSNARNIPLPEVLKEADEYIDEIAANYKKTTIHAGAIALKWIFSNVFEGITVNSNVLEDVKRRSRKAPLILVPCHKSHMDYMILSYLFHINSMPCPHVAAGVNLSFWPVGPFFRTGGAFFLRRTFKGNPLYAKVFAEYIYKLLNEGFNVEFFIEGGRSRTGKLLPPKPGMLSIALDAYKNGACPDLIFVPVFVGYDKVMEEKEYLKEVEGGEKKSENFSQFIRARKFLKKKYGRIYVKFHEPLSLNEFLEKNKCSLDDMSRDESRSFQKNFSHRILNAIDRMAVVTPHAIVAAALLNCEKKHFSIQRLEKEIDMYMHYLLEINATLSDTLLINPSRAIEASLDEYVDRKLVERHGGDTDKKDIRFIVNTSKRGILDYYKNNCVSYFIPAAYTALAILEKDSFQFSSVEMSQRYVFLQTLFQREFFLDIDKSPEHFIESNLRIFMDGAIISPHYSLPDTYNITSEGFRKLRLFAGFAMTYFESYWIVLRYLGKVSEKSRKSKEPKQIIKKISALGSRLHKIDQIERAEALSGISYKNALEFFSSEGMEHAGDSEKIAVYEKQIKKYIDLL